MRTQGHIITPQDRERGRLQWVSYADMLRSQYVGKPDSERPDPEVFDSIMENFKRWDFFTNVRGAAANAYQTFKLGGLADPDFDLRELENPGEPHHSVKNPYVHIGGYEDFIDRFEGARSVDEVYYIASRIEGELRQLDIVDRSGAVGMVTAVATGFLNPLNFIPAAHVLRGARLAGLAAKASRGIAAGRALRAGKLKSAAALGAEASLAASAEQVALHAARETETLADSATYVGFAALTGSTLGFVGASVRRAARGRRAIGRQQERAERARLEAKIKAGDQELTDSVPKKGAGDPLATGDEGVDLPVRKPGDPLEVTAAAKKDTPALHPGPGKPDSVFVKLGDKAGKIPKSIWRYMIPKYHLQTSPIDAVRWGMRNLMQVTGRMHGISPRNDPAEIIVDVLTRDADRALQGVREIFWKEASPSPFRLGSGESEFNKEVVRTLRLSKDDFDVAKGANPDAWKAANLLRSRVFDPLFKRAEELGVLAKEDKFFGYFSRYYDTEGVLSTDAGKERFIDVVSGLLGADPNVGAKAARAQALGAYKSIMKEGSKGLGEGRLAKAAKDRTLGHLSDNDLEEFLVSDLPLIVKRYTRTFGGSLVLQERMGRGVLNLLMKDAGAMADKAHEGMGSLLAAVKKSADELEAHSKAIDEAVEYRKWHVGKTKDEGRKAVEGIRKELKAEATSKKLKVSTVLSKGWRTRTSLRVPKNGTLPKAVTDGDKAIKAALEKTRDELETIEGLFLEQVGTVEMRKATKLALQAAKAEAVEAKKAGVASRSLALQEAMTPERGAGGAGWKKAVEAKFSSKEKSPLAKAFEEKKSDFADYVDGAVEKLKQEWGGADLRLWFDEVTTAFHKLRDSGPRGGRAKIDGEMNRTLSFMEDVRNTLRGVYGMSPDPAAKLPRTLKAMRDLNYSVLGGFIFLSSIPDLAYISLTTGFRDAFAPLMNKWRTGMKDVRLLIRSDLEDLIFATDTLLRNTGGSRNIGLGDAGDIAGSTEIEGALHWAAHATSIFSLSAWWNKNMKYLSGEACMRMIMRNVKSIGETGKWANSLDKKRIVYVGLDKESLKGMHGQWVKHGHIDRESGKRILFAPNASAWDTTQREQMRNGLLQFQKNTILSGSPLDMPKIMPGLRASMAPGERAALDAWSKTIFQFFNHTFQAHSRVLMRSLELRDRRVAANLVFMVMLGMFSSALKLKAKGQEIPEIDEWIFQGIDQSGVLALLFDISRPLEEATGGKVGVAPVLSALGLESAGGFYSPAAVYTTFMGSSVSMPISAAKLSSRVLTSDTFTQADARNLRRITPFSNLFYLTAILNKLIEEMPEKDGP